MQTGSGVNMQLQKKGRKEKKWEKLRDAWLEAAAVSKRWSCLIWRGVLIWRWRGFPLCNGSTRGRNELEFHNNGSRTQRKPVTVNAGAGVLLGLEDGAPFRGSADPHTHQHGHRSTNSRWPCEVTGGRFVCKYAEFSLLAVLSVRPAAPVRLRGDLPQER